MQIRLLLLPALLLAVFVSLIPSVHAEFLGSESDYEIIREDTIWSGSFVQKSVYRPVVLVDGATLTIEPGTRVEIGKLQVFNGKISAKGTKERPIVFTTMPEDWSWLSPSYEKYDRECFYREIPEGTVEFVDLADDENGTLNETSVFEYVVFEKLGSLIDHDGVNCPVFQTKKHVIPFVSTVFAARPYYRETPAFSFESGRVDMDHVIFRENRFTDILADVYIDTQWGEESSLSISESDFEGSENNTALSSAITVFTEEGEPEESEKEPFFDAVFLSQNWYGDASGPKTEEYPEGRGTQLKGDFTLDGWSVEPSVELSVNSSVLFLPGFKGSRLYTKDDDGDEDQLWLPTLFSNDTEELMMTEGGESEALVYTRDTLVTTPIGALYQSFFEDLEEMKIEGSIANWKSFSYDWRYDVRDIVENGTLYPDNEVKSLVETVETLAQDSYSGKVTIIAHSNGGLLAKALLVKLEALGKSDLADKVVLVGSPQIGTPLANFALLYGYEESIPFLISNEKARELGETMPGAYGLLPSQTYLNLVGDSEAYDSFISFSSENTRYRKYRETYGENIDSYDELLAFLSGRDWGGVDGDGRDEPDSDETDQENTLRQSLLEQAVATHTVIDAWMPPEGVKVIQIAGWGLDTVSGVEYTEKPKVECRQVVWSPGIPVCKETGEYEPVYEPRFTVDGDEVVVTPSALYMSDGAERWWFNMYEYNEIPSNRGVSHKDILEATPVQSFVNHIIVGNEEIAPFILRQRPSTLDSDRIRISLHSPLTLTLTDEAGNTTGLQPQTIDGEVMDVITTGIPGSSYFRFGERTYASIPIGTSFTIGLDGYEDGSYTLTLEEIGFDGDGEETVGDTVTFQNLPVSENTTATLAVGKEGLTALGDLEVDYNSETEGGEYTVEPILNDEATYDPEPEDTTHPEVRIGFDTETRTLLFFGIDDLSLSENIKREIETYTEEEIMYVPCKPGYWWQWRKEKMCEKTIKKDYIRTTLIDEAGNETRIILEDKTKENSTIHVIPLSVSYGEDRHVLVNNDIKYFWHDPRRNRDTQWIITSLRADVSFGVGFYQSHRDQTEIWMYPNEEGKTQRSTQDGIALPVFETDQGSSRIHL